jgi:hypothetical protein
VFRTEEPNVVVRVRSTTGNGDDPAAAESGRALTDARRARGDR